MSETISQVSVFFSWQSDSDKKTNLNFIEDCLKKAVREISKEESFVIIIDRDTKGVGGSPSIVDTIFKKIRSCDIFVWDGTIVNDSGRLTPNPNVLIELGYAFAVIGEGRIIGVLNESNGNGPEKLPFDLVHRRWPIRYTLHINVADSNTQKIEVKVDLINSLKIAILSALKEPKQGIIQSDIDFHTCKKLWEIINSNWFSNWTYIRRKNIQYEKVKNLKKFEDYYFIAKKAEFQFVDESLRRLHDNFIKAIQNYLTVAVSEMCIHHGNNEILVINIKDQARREGWIENYDEIYDRQINNLFKAIEKVEIEWDEYVKYLRVKYFEITHHSETF